MATRSRVKWFDPKKGFGFIEGPSGHDVFVHFSQIRGEGFRSLKDGEEVEYELVEGDKGMQAQDVQRVGGDDADGGDADGGDADGDDADGGDADDQDDL